MDTIERENCKCERLDCKGCYYDRDEVLIPEAEVRKFIDRIIDKIDRASGKFETIAGDEVYRIIKSYIQDKQKEFHKRVQRYRF